MEWRTKLADAIHGAFIKIEDRREKKEVLRGRVTDQRFEEAGFDILRIQLDTGYQLVVFHEDEAKE